MGPHSVTTVSRRAGGLDAWTVSICALLAGVLCPSFPAAGQYGIGVKSLNSGRPQPLNIQELGPNTSMSILHPGVGRLPGGGRPSLALPLFTRGRVNRMQVPGRTIRGDSVRYALLLRRQRLVNDHSLGNTVRRLSEDIVGPRLHAPMRQIDVDRTLERMDPAASSERPSISEHLVERMAAYQRERTTDGWSYFKKGDYLRSRAAFEAAEPIDRSDPIPRFGQLLSSAASTHYSRAVYKLSRIAERDEQDLSGVPTMFEYDISLQAAFADEEELDQFIGMLRRFAERHSDSQGAQALYCYLLWYCRLEDAALEAAGVAARIKAADPTSPWARFESMMQDAQRKIRDAGDRERQPRGTTSDVTLEPLPAG